MKLYSNEPKLQFLDVLVRKPHCKKRQINSAVVFWLAMAGASVFVGGCASTPPAVDAWSQEIKAANFKPLYPPTSESVIGYVYAFDSAGKEILVRSLGDDCKALKTAPKLDEIKLIFGQQDTENSASLAASLTKALKGTVDASGTIGMNSIRKVKVTFGKLHTETLATGPLADDISAMDKAGPCYKSAIGKNNVVVYKALVADSVKFTFHLEDGAQAKIDVNILKNIKLNPEAKHHVVRDQELEISKPMYIGYQAMQARELPAMAKSGSIDKRELSYIDLMAIAKGGSAR